MRKRNFVIGAASALVLSVAVAGVAQAAGTLLGQTVTATVSSPKQDKKTPGKLTSFNVAVDTQYDGNNSAPFTGKVNNTKVDFPKDWSFTTGSLPQCDVNQIGTVTTAAAITLCGSSQVGSGTASIRGLGFNTAAVVTAFNGLQPEGLPVVLLHSRTAAPLNSTSVLVGTIRNGPGGQYGKTLDVPVPLLGGGALVITNFNTTIPNPGTSMPQTVKKNKKKGKPAKFFVMAKCSTKSWAFGLRSTADAGNTAPTDSKALPCSQKKKKKKKKK